MDNTIFEQINSAIFAAIFNDPSRAFPEYEFNFRGGHYESSINASGEKSKRKDKTILKLWNGIATILFNDESGESTNAIKFYASKNNLTYSAASKKLCQIYGIEWPQTDSPEYIAYLKEQETKAEIFKEARKALFSETGAPVMKYLINGRKWPIELINKIEEIGAVTPELVQKYSTAKFWPNIVRNSNDPFLVIPIYSNNALQGFKFRILNAQGANKYINSVGYKKGSNPLLLTGYKVSPAEKQKGLIIVEGELDALHAKAEGINNVIAVAGGDISEDLAAKLQNLGVIRVTFILDSEDNEKTAAGTAHKADKNISILDKYGITALIAEFPQLQGIKTDTDSYLLNHSVEELNKIIYAAKVGQIYQLEKIFERYTDNNENSPKVSYTNFVDLAKEIEDLAYKTKILYNRDLIYNIAEKLSAKNILSETLKKAVEARESSGKEEEIKAKFIKDIQEAAQKAGALANEGKTEKAAEALAKVATDIKNTSSASEFAELAANPEYSLFMKDLADEAPGVKTGYYYGGRSAEDELILPSGALTFVCGLPGHGKSRFMQNLAVAAAMKEAEGQIIYITLEESKGAIFKEMANLYANIKLSANNLRTISSSYKNGSEYVKTEFKANYTQYKSKEKEFLQKYICAGKLQIIALDYGSTKIESFIKYLIENKAPRMIFIDYMQLMYKEGNTKARHEELKDICREFNDIAKAAGIPFIIGSQFNRQAYSPAEWSAQNISEASDIEKIANTIIAVWHSKAKPLIGTSWGRDKADIQAWENSNNIKLGEYGKMYSELLKNRFGKKNISAVFNWDENTGRIEDSGQSGEGSQFASIVPEQPKIFDCDEKENSDDDFPF